MANKIQKLKNSTNDTIYPVTVKDAIYDNLGNPLSIADTASVVTVDAKVGDLSLLTTTNKTSAVNAINEVDSDVTSLVNTVNGINSNINAVDNKIGLLSALETVDKTNVVGAINENFGHIGDLSTLTTTDKSNLVRATNELNSAIGQIASDLNAHKADLATDTDGAHGLKIESGTFTPYLYGDTVAGSPTYVSRSGTYYKIGNFVVVKFSIQISNKGGMSGNLFIGGLPFVSNGSYSMLSPTYFGLTLTSGVLIGYTSHSDVIHLSTGSSGINDSLISNDFSIWTADCSYLVP